MVKLRLMRRDERFDAESTKTKIAFMVVQVRCRLRMQQQHCCCGVVVT